MLYYQKDILFHRVELAWAMINVAVTIYDLLDSQTDV